MLIDIHYVDQQLTSSDRNMLFLILPACTICILDFDENDDIIIRIFNIEFW